MASQIPPLLESYLSLPPETSQIVLTGILGASTNWLTLRYLYSLLRPVNAAAPRRNGDGDADGAGEDVKVLLVSFMRDHAFWKEGAGRLVYLPLLTPSHCLLRPFSYPNQNPMCENTIIDTVHTQGLNLDALAARGKFLFVDGLSRLFLGGGDGPVALPAGRGPGHQQHLYLDSPRLADVARVLAAAVERLQTAGGKVVLILDQPDVLLAAASPGDGFTGTAWKDVLLGLREVSYFNPSRLLSDVGRFGATVGNTPSSGSISTLLCSSLYVSGQC